MINEPAYLLPRENEKLVPRSLPGKIFTSTGAIHFMKSLRCNKNHDGQMESEEESDNLLATLYQRDRNGHEERVQSRRIADLRKRSIKWKNLERRKRNKLI